MKVLQIYRDYFIRMPGGIERHVRDLATGLVGRVDVEVMASSGRRHPVSVIDEGAQIHLVRELGRVSGVPVWTGTRKVMRGSYDLMHLHAPNPTGEVVVSTFRPDVPVVMTYHADVFKAPLAVALYRPLLRHALRRADRIVVSTQAFAERSPMIAPILKRDPERIEVIPFGVDLDRFTPAQTQRSRAFRESWGNRPVILFVGRLRHYKGLLDLVNAVERTDHTLVVAGNGPERPPLLDAAQSLGERFTWLGPVSDQVLPDILRAADVFCLPSTSSAETFGIATAEAIASGLPAITTEVGTGTSVVNKHGVTGLVVPPSDPVALSEAFGTILGDDALRRRMAVAARQRAEEMFGRDLMLDRVQSLYERLLA